MSSRKTDTHIHTGIQHINMYKVCIYLAFPCFGLLPSVIYEIDEKTEDALQADCTHYAPGIEIISVHVMKPTIPKSIRRNFEEMEEKRTTVSNLELHSTSRLFCLLYPFYKNGPAKDRLWSVEALSGRSW